MDAPGTAAEPSPGPTDRRRWGTIAAVVVVVWLVAVVSAALLARGDLNDARVDLRAVQDAVADGDLNAGAAALSEAEAELATASSRLGRPDVVVASWVPVLGRNLSVTRTLADGSLAVVQAGGDALGALDGLRNGTDTGGSALPIEPLLAVGEPLRRMSEAADAAVAAAEAAPTSGLVGEVADARADFLELLSPVADQVRVASGIADALPGFLGAEGPRRYFLAAANPAELRGAGGFLGAYSILTIDGGELDFGRFRELAALPDLPQGEVDPGGLVADRWVPFEPTSQWKNVNLTPDVPTAARTIEAMWEAGTGERLDGVVIVDPFALQILLEITGPVRGPDGVEVTSDGVVDYLTHDAYAELTDPADRKEVLGGVATAVLERFLRNAGAALEHADALGQLVGDRHLMLHSADPDVQAAFEAAGVAGALPTGSGDLVAVVANSATNAKLDWFLERSLRYEVELGADGGAVGDLTVVFENTAPTTGEVEYVIGPNVDGLEAGDNRFHLSTYCAVGCELVSARGGPGDRMFPGEELGLGVVGSWVEIAAGGSEELNYVWRNPSAWTDRDGELVYELLLRAQTAIREPDLEVVVHIPDGFEVVTAPRRASVEGDRLVWRASRRGDVRLTYVFRPVEAQIVDDP